MTTAARNEEELIAAAIAGDHRAFEQLVKPYLPRFKYTLFDYLKNAHDVDDTLQEVLLRIHRYLPRFDGRAQFSTWCYTICANQARTAYTKKRRRFTDVSLSDDELSAAFEAMLVSEDTGDAHMEATQELEKMSAALACVAAQSEKAAEAWQLRYLEQLSTKQAAQKLNCSENAVRSRVFRAQKMLEERGVESGAFYKFAA